MKAGATIVLSVGCVVVAAMAGLAWAKGRRAEVQARLDVFVAELERRNAQPVTGREAVYGETLDGDATEHYVAAARKLATHGLTDRDMDTCMPLVHGERALSKEERERLAPSLPAALASVRSGVRCSRRTRGATFERAVLAAVVADAVERAFAANDVAGGAELFVDQCVYAIDVYGDPVVPRFEDEWLRRLDATTGAFLVDALHRVDARWPRFEAAEGFLADMIRTCSAYGRFDQSFTDGLDAYEYGFDAWWRQLAYCERMVARLPLLSPSAEPWAERQAQITDFGATGSDAPRGVATILPAILRGLEHSKRLQLAKLRMLRLAIAFVRGLELPRLDDPLGSGPIEVDVNGDEATFRSEGTEDEKRLERTVRRR